MLGQITKREQTRRQSRPKTKYHIGWDLNYQQISRTFYSNINDDMDSCV